MASYSYTNGRYLPNHKAKISINDRSVHFADAVYEVITVYKFKMLFWSDHIIRLKKSLKYMDINFKSDFKILKIKCEELIKINNLGEGIIYVHVSRGVAKRNHNWNENLKPSLIISCMHKKTFNVSAKKISLISDNDIRWHKCYIKTVSLLANVLLKQKAMKNKAFECLMVDNLGYVTEATTSNIWILKNNILFTTPLSSNILAGVTRKKVLELAKGLNIKVIEKKFKINDVYKADSVFITNSSSLILEANKLNNKKLSSAPNALIKCLKSSMLELINNE